MLASLALISELQNIIPNLLGHPVEGLYFEGRLSLFFTKVMTSCTTTHVAYVCMKCKIKSANLA